MKRMDNNLVIWSNWNPETEDDYDLDMALEDERANLNIKLNGMIVVIADLGLWDGRRMGYKLISSGNIKDCLHDNCEYITWYCDRYNFRAVACHHDGINRYLYRVFRDDVSGTQIGKFLRRVARGEANDRMIRRYTKSIRPEIVKVYGWK